MVPSKTNNMIGKKKNLGSNRQGKKLRSTNKESNKTPGPNKEFSVIDSTSSLKLSPTKMQHASILFPN